MQLSRTIIKNIIKTPVTWLYLAAALAVFIGGYETSKLFNGDPLKAETKAAVVVVSQRKAAATKQAKKLQKDVSTTEQRIQEYDAAKEESDTALNDYAVPLPAPVAKTLDRADAAVKACSLVVLSCKETVALKDSVIVSQDSVITLQKKQLRGRTWGTVKSVVIGALFGYAIAKGMAH